MPSISAQQARDERLSIYCSPKFCHRSKLDSQLITEKADDFGWLNTFDPRRGARAGHKSSATSQKQPELRRIVIIRRNSERQPLIVNRDSMAASEEAPNTAEQTATENLLAKKKKQRPFSLIVEGNVTLNVPSISTNASHRSCCNLRNDAAEAPGSLSMNHKSLLSTAKNERADNLSRSCGDLRNDLDDCNRGGGGGGGAGGSGLWPDLQRNSVSQMSLYSGQISTPTESNRTGSRISLLSEGVESYEELYDKAYKATFVLGTPSPLTVSEEKVPRDRMVRDWLNKHNHGDDDTSSKTTTSTASSSVQ